MIHYLPLDVPIYEQLRIEEALLRTDERNWCIVNEGSPPAVVMGISGKLDELNHPLTLPVIKRFSGGGTVVVDDDTLFVTLMGNKDDLPVDCFPEPLMRWTEGVYAPVFDHPKFALKENDYVFDKLKFGGNAQYIRKDRWLHHTTFLWDYTPERMSALPLPKKRPAYRQDRCHNDFLCCLKDHLPNKEALFERLRQSLGNHFTIVEATLDDIDLSKPHRQALALVSDPT